MEQSGNLWSNLWDLVENFEQFIDIINTNDKWTRAHIAIIGKEIQRYKGKRFLEAGCGLGQWCFYAQDNGMEAIGIDFSEKTVNMLNAYCRSKACHVPRFIVGDLRNSIENLGYFDLFTCLGVIEHFSPAEYGKILNNLFNLTKPCGTGIITTPNLWSLHTIFRPLAKALGKWDLGYETSFSPGALERIVELAGFEVVERGIIPCGETFGVTLNHLPFVKKLSYAIELNQSTIGLISYVKVMRK